MTQQPLPPGKSGWYHLNIQVCIGVQRSSKLDCSNICTYSQNFRPFINNPSTLQAMWRGIQKCKNSSLNMHVCLCWFRCSHVSFIPQLLFLDPFSSVFMRCCMMSRFSSFYVTSRTSTRSCRPFCQRYLNNEVRWKFTTSRRSTLRRRSRRLSPLPQYWRKREMPRTSLYQLVSPLLFVADIFLIAILKSQGIIKLSYAEKKQSGMVITPPA